ncbi:hypothetical protein HaLaN_15000, partial [Haematococcus lacustris]
MPAATPKGRTLIICLLALCWRGDAQGQDAKPLSSGAIVGICFGSVIAALFLVCVLKSWRARMKRHNEARYSTQCSSDAMHKAKEKGFGADPAVVWTFSRGLDLEQPLDWKPGSVELITGRSHVIDRVLSKSKNSSVTLEVSRNVPVVLEDEVHGLDMLAPPPLERTTSPTHQPMCGTTPAKTASILNWMSAAEDPTAS